MTILTSQSLLHQVRCSYLAGRGEGSPQDRVSIPSSSGQVFLPAERYYPAYTVPGLNPFFIRSGVPTYGDDPYGAQAWVSIPSSSGQVFLLRDCEKGRCHYRCRNPFFIRSGVPTRPRRGSAAASGPSRNPFFIRSGVPTSRASSSRGKRTKSQSLLHQVRCSYEN